jgi:hypothetical protein
LDAFFAFMSMNVISLLLVLTLNSPAIASANLAVPSANVVASPQYMILQITYTRNNKGVVPHLKLVTSTNKTLVAANGFNMSESTQVRYSKTNGTIEILQTVIDVVNKAAEVGWMLQNMETSVLPGGATVTNYVLFKE